MTTAQFEEMIAGAAPTINTDSISSKLQANATAWKDYTFDEMLTRIINELVSFSIRLCVAILVFYVGKFIIGKLYKFLANIFIRRRIEPSLATFLLSLVRIVLYFILIVTVIGILGINTASFLALFASAGVAVGLALSGTLQNFAGGVLILLLKPYKIGDYIEAQGYAGTVKEIQIFSTILTTADNKSILIPNGGLSTGSINNYSREDYRRVDWTVSIAYGDDVNAARAAILAILDSDDRIVKRYVEDDREQRNLQKAEQAAEDCAINGNCQAEEQEKPRGFWYKLTHKKKKVAQLTEFDEKTPLEIIAQVAKKDCSPMVAVKELNSSSVDLTVRAWTQSSLYWSVFFEMNERFYKELPGHGINFPFPQLDVHLQQTGANS